MRLSLYSFFTPGHFGQTEVAAVFYAMRKKSILEVLDFRLKRWCRRCGVNIDFFFLTSFSLMCALAFSAGALWMSTRDLEHDLKRTEEFHRLEQQLYIQYMNSRGSH